MDDAQGENDTAAHNKGINALLRFCGVVGVVLVFTPLNPGIKWPVSVILIFVGLAGLHELKREALQRFRRWLSSDGDGIVKKSVRRALNRSKRKDVESSLEEYLKALREEWLKFITFNELNSKYHWAVRMELTRAYFNEEVRDISGEADLADRGNPPKFVSDSSVGRIHEPQPLIVTNFVNYSSQVRALVESCRTYLNDNPKMVLFCFTLLSMPLTKWYNFDQKKNRVNKRWDEYLGFLGDLVTEFEIEGGRQFLCRCLLVDEESRNVNVLEEEASHWIWATNDGGPGKRVVSPLQKSERYQDPRWPGLDPLPTSWENLVKKLREDAKMSAAADYIASTYPEDSPSYIILPKDRVPAVGYSNHHGAFLRLGDQFGVDYTSAHSNLGRLLLYSKPTKKFIYGYKGYRPPAPTDFFYVAGVSADDIHGAKSYSDLAEMKRERIFLLAGSEDSALKTIHLYLIDPHHAKKRFEWVEDRIKELLKDGKPFTSLLP